jgi:hypothetical protein
MNHVIFWKAVFKHKQMDIDTQLEHFAFGMVS